MARQNFSDFIPTNLACLHGILRACSDRLLSVRKGTSHTKSKSVSVLAGENNADDGAGNGGHCILPSYMESAFCRGVWRMRLKSRSSIGISLRSPMEEFVAHWILVLNPTTSWTQCSTKGSWTQLLLSSLLLRKQVISQSPDSFALSLSSYSGRPLHISLGGRHHDEMAV